MLSWISDHPGWDTQELWWKMCATTHRTQRYESPWLPGIGIKGVLPNLWVKDDNIPLTLKGQGGSLILSFTEEILLLEILCNQFLQMSFVNNNENKHLAIWCLLVASEMTSPTKDSSLEVNNSTFIIWWIHSSIAANLNAKWWIIFFNLFAFSEARNSRNIRLPSGSITPYILSHTQSVIKGKKGFSMSMPNPGI